MMIKPTPASPDGFGDAPKQRLCLSMIVKNEAAVIARCLASVQPLIDCWCIVDTGSVDQTREIIAAQLSGLPGELHNRRWRDFASNRNEALALARAFLHGEQSASTPTQVDDYLLLIDADESLSLPADFRISRLDASAYDLELRFGDLSYRRPSLIAARVDWAYVGVLHEYLQCPGQPVPELLAGPTVIVRPEGARSKNPRKYHDDASMLEAAVRSDPNNSRDQFYLAQSYRDSGQLEAALAAYQKRAAMPGWVEENWYARFQVAAMLERLAGDADAVTAAYHAAYVARPTRAETLVEQARWHRLRSEFGAALLCARAAAQIPLPNDRLFIDRACYGWRALDEWSISAYYCECYAEGLSVIRRLLDSSPPAEHLPRIQANLGFYEGR